MNRRLKPIWTIEADPAGAGGDGGAGGTGEPETFSQADVDRIVKERVKRAETKYADYADLKAKAEGAKSTEDRMAELEKQLATTQHEALRSRVQAAHKISDADAALFLTGADETALTAQAKGLADRESQRKSTNNVSPREGTATASSETDEMRAFTRGLFGKGD